MTLRIIRTREREEMRPVVVEHDNRVIRIDRVRRSPPATLEMANGEVFQGRGIRNVDQEALRQFGIVLFQTVNDPSAIRLSPEHDPGARRDCALGDLFVECSVFSFHESSSGQQRTSLGRE